MKRDWMKHLYLLWLCVQFDLSFQSLSFNSLNPSPTNCLMTTSYADSLYYACASGKDIHKYHVDTDTWSMKGTHPSLGSRYGALPVHNGRLFFVGGIIDGTATKLSELWAYNIVTDGWEAKTDLPSTMSFVASAVYNDKLYALDGTTFRRYTINQDIWNERASPPRSHYACGGALSGLQFVAAGAYVSDDSAKFADMFNIQTGSWTQLADIPHRLSVPPTLAWCGSVYYFGGETVPDTGPPANKHNAVLQYTLATNKWTTLGYLPSVTSRRGAIAFNGRAYVAGMWWTEIPHASLCGDPMLTNMDGQQFKLPLQPDTVYTLLSSPSLSLAAMVEASATLPPEDNVVVTRVGVRAGVGSDSVWLAVDCSRLSVLPPSRAPDSTAAAGSFCFNDTLTVTKTDDGSVMIGTALYSVLLSPQLVALLVTRSEAADAVWTYPPSGWLDVRVVPHGGAACRGLLCHAFSTETLSDVEAYKVESGSLFGDDSVFL